jgi:hypothetical protein
MTGFLKTTLCIVSVWAGQAAALVSDGGSGAPSSVFVAVFDPDNRQSYYQDLNVSMEAFLKNPSGGVDLSQDGNFSAFLGKPNLIYNVAAFSALKSDQGNLGTWGYLATSAEGRGIFGRDFVPVDAVRQKMQIYAAYLTGSSGVFGAGDPGYFDGGYWGASLGGTVGGSTVGRVGQAVPFYFVSNATGDPAGGVARPLGAWTLANDGKLGFSPQGTSNAPPVAEVGSPLAVDQGSQVTLDGSGSRDPDDEPDPLVFAWNQTGGPLAVLNGDNTAKASFTATKAGTYTFRLAVGDGDASSTATVTVTANPVNQPPAANAGAHQTAVQGTLVTLDGSASQDPDNGPGPLNYQWTQTSGPGVTLTRDQTAQTTFMAPQPGAYGFQLTVSDGMAFSTAATQVDVSAQKIISLNVPNLWKAKVKGMIAWDPGELPGGRQVKIRFAKDGVKFKTLAITKAKKRAIAWKPKRNQATNQGVLQICVKPTHKAPPVCDSVQVVVQL